MNSNDNRSDRYGKSPRPAEETLDDDHAAVTLVIDPETGAIVSANHAAAVFYGWSRETLMRMNIQDIHTLPFHEIKQRMAAALERRQVHFEFRHRVADGSIRDVEAFSSRVAMGGRYYLHTIYHDITDRKQAEAALRRSDGKHRLLFENAGDAIYILDMAGRMLAVNSEASRQLGYSHATLMSMTAGEVDTPEEARRVPERIALLKAQGSLRFETTHRRRDGTRMSVEVNARTITWDDQPANMSICRDITERKRAQEELKRVESLNRNLQKAESLSRMAGAIAHYFNNQLAVVMGNIEMVMEDLPQHDELLENLTEAMSAARSASEMSALMLTYLGQTAAKKEPLDISEACLGSLPLLRASLPTSVLLETDIPSHGPTIDGNLNQIRQVLTQLVANAWESIDGGGGRVHLRVKTVTSGLIPASHRHPIDWVPQENRDYACLEVSDQGCGIAEKDIEKIFDPFFTRKFIGRGLGLSVVLGILRIHRGAIVVESQPGRGSCFRVFFPVSDQSVSASADGI